MKKSAATKALQLFGTNAGITPVKTPTPTKKDEREVIEYGKDLDTLAAISIIADALTETGKALKDELKEKTYEIFTKKAIQLQRKPDTFTASGQRAQAEVQLKKRASNSPLEPETLEALSKLGVTEATGGVQRLETIPERLVLNPDVVENQEMLKAIAEAISKHPKLKDVPVILKQDAEERFVTTDETIPQMTRSDNPALSIATRALLPLVSTVAIGKFHIDNLQDPALLLKRALEIVKEAKLLPATDTPKAGKKARN